MRVPQAGLQSIHCGRGRDGPLEITVGGDSSPLYQAYVEAGQQAGYPFTEDVNGIRQEGVFYMERTVLGGVRNSAARAWPHPALHRPSLEARTNTTINRILLEGSRAVGVEYIERDRSRTLRAERGVVLSAGPSTLRKLSCVLG